MKIPIPTKIKLARTALNKTRKDIALEINLDQSAIAYIEKVKKDNPFVIYLTYLRKEGVDINKLFEDDEAN